MTDACSTGGFTVIRVATAPFWPADAKLLTDDAQQVQWGGGAVRARLPVARVKCHGFHVTCHVFLVTFYVLLQYWALMDEFVADAAA